MHEPAIRPTWASLPMVVRALFADGKPGHAGDSMVERVYRDLRSGASSPPTVRTFKGPCSFFRAVGMSAGGRPNTAYSGAWWFSEEQLRHIERIVRMHSPGDRRAVIRACLREVTAVSVEWNSMTEIWQLSLPARESLTGFESAAKPQPHSQDLPSGRQLTGGATQIYLPVKNPLWIRRYA